MPEISEFPQQVQPMLSLPLWRIIVRPQSFVPGRIPFSKLEGTLRELQVRLRGWYFPHLSRQPDEIIRGRDYYATFSVFTNYEYSRFYESAQFIHYRGLREYVDESYYRELEALNKRNLDWLHPDWSEVTGYIDIINFLYSVTEIFEFAARLGNFLSLDEPMHIEIMLEKIRGFILGVSDESRSWQDFYQWKHATLGRVWDIDAKELFFDSKRHSLSAVEWFFQRFGWVDANTRALADAQSGLLSTKR